MAPLVSGPPASYLLLEYGGAGISGRREEVSGWSLRDRPVDEEHHFDAFQ